MKFRLDTPADREIYIRHISAADFPMCDAGRSPAESIVALLQLLHKDVCGVTSENWMGTGRSFINDSFVGYFCKASQCSNCGKTATSFEPFCVIDIPVVGTEKRIANVKITTLMACVTHFLTQRVAAIKSCDACAEFTERVQSLDFWGLPPVLAFHLKNEENAFVEFPDGLDLNHLVHRDQRSGENGRYRLFAVVNREGANWGVNVIVQNPMLDRPEIGAEWFAFGPNFAMLSPGRSWHSSQASVLLYERW
jgi:hypothetical protein